MSPDEAQALEDPAAATADEVPPRSQVAGPVADRATMAPTPRKRAQVAGGVALAIALVVAAHLSPDPRATDSEPFCESEWEDNRDTGLNQFKTHDQFIRDCLAAEAHAGAQIEHDARVAADHR